MVAVRLDNKGNIQIPEDIRRRHGWCEGTEYQVIDRDGRLTLVPMHGNGTPAPDDPLSTREFLERHAGSADGGLTTEELMAMTRSDD